MMGAHQIIAQRQQHGRPPPAGAPAGCGCCPPSRAPSSRGSSSRGEEAGCGRHPLGRAPTGQRAVLLLVLDDWSLLPGGARRMSRGSDRVGDEDEMTDRIRWAGDEDEWMTDRMSWFARRLPAGGWGLGH
ncbi:uncharacterized protein [Zea mays]|jgi:hypothetical protein|uniref:Uncharacterized protein n=1 Tax=Zea mays TaxID=4577 RepID=C4IYZ8_MAIZE|nr:uncharacterized protein LOC103630009 [Zea mays]ACR34148.1 unknown [Zea mays]|eukprot:XP_008649323.1 uncharacterized protein LOC103630009 [Zea mays]